MVEIHATTAVMVLGLLISALIALCLIGILNLLGYTRIKGDQLALLDQDDGLQSQIARLVGWLGAIYGYDQEQCDQLVAKLSMEESALFDLMRNNATNRNLTGMSQMMVHYENIKRLFADFAPYTQGDSAANTDMTGLTHQVAILTQENKQISGELKIAVETMNSVIGEYSMMFSQQEDLEELQESRKRVMGMLDKFCAAHDIEPAAAANDPTEAASSPDEDHDEDPDAQALAANS
ncbi:MAG TPA: hypothetical protein DCF45_06570 [Gammaproteobacteria bacterium]|nr:hypothetical protein [Gammaproteobacteria bacterium]